MSFEVRDRPWVSPREVALDPGWQAPVTYRDASGDTRRVLHRPDLATQVKGGRVASIRNAYLPEAVVLGAWLVAIAMRSWTVALAIAPLMTFALGASLAGRHRCVSDVDAGEELRRHEQDRGWMRAMRTHRYGASEAADSAGHAGN